MINITCNQILTLYGQYHFAPFDLHLRGAMIIVVTMISIIMISIIVSS